MFRTATGWVLAAVAGAVATGCGADPTPQAVVVPDEKKVAIEEVYSLLQLYAERGKGPPHRAADLRPLENAYPMGYDVVRSGAVVVSWGVDPAETSDAVLAYHKEVPAAGGWVLLQNGTVRAMTADEFKAARKAGA